MNCLLFSVKTSKDVLILLDTNFMILGISRTFAVNILRLKDLDFIHLIIGKPVGTFLPNFEERYEENKEFSYENNNNEQMTMKIKSKTISYGNISCISLRIINLKITAFRYPTTLARIVRKSTLSLINFSDSPTELFDHSNVNMPTTKIKLNADDPPVESCKFDYEPDSITHIKEEIEDSSTFLNEFSRAVLISKIYLILL